MSLLAYVERFKNGSTQSSNSNSNSSNSNAIFDIILASGSPRRKEIIKNAWGWGVPFRVVTSDIEETMDQNERDRVRKTKGPGQYAEYLATLKGQDWFKRAIMLSQSQQGDAEQLKTELQRATKKRKLDADEKSGSHQLNDKSGSDFVDIMLGRGDYALYKKKNEIKQKQGSHNWQTVSVPMMSQTNSSSSTTINTNGNGTTTTTSTGSNSNLENTQKTQIVTILIAADSVVVDKDGNILEKPNGHAKPEQAAKQMLHKLLKDGENFVYSGVYCKIKVQHQDQSQQQQQKDQDQETKFSFFEKTRVVFRSKDLQTEEEINNVVESYVATQEPLDKAGGYGLQAMGGLLVDKIDGCYFNVVGLPISGLSQRLAKKLQEMGV